MDDEEAEKIGPSGFEETGGFREEPYLMLVALVVGWTTQFGRRFYELEAEFLGVVREDSEFLVEIGRTALKTRSCFTAAAELFNVCFERDSRSSLAWFMGGH